jgi:hypothetical protein
MKSLLLTLTLILLTPSVQSVKYYHVYTKYIGAAYIESFVYHAFPHPFEIYTDGDDRLKYWRAFDNGVQNGVHLPMTLQTNSEASCERVLLNSYSGKENKKKVTNPVSFYVYATRIIKYNPGADGVIKDDNIQEVKDEYALVLNKDVELRQNDFNRTLGVSREVWRFDGGNYSFTLKADDKLMYRKTIAQGPFNANDLKTFKTENLQNILNQPMDQKMTDKNDRFILKLSKDMDRQYQTFLDQKTGWVANAANGPNWYNQSQDDWPNEFNNQRQAGNDSMYAYMQIQFFETYLNKKKEVSSSDGGLFKHNYMYDFVYGNDAPEFTQDKDYFFNEVANENIAKLNGGNQMPHSNRFFEVGDINTDNGDFEAALTQMDNSVNKNKEFRALANDLALLVPVENNQVNVINENANEVNIDENTSMRSNDSADLNDTSQQSGKSRKSKRSWRRKNKSNNTSENTSEKKKKRPFGLFIPKDSEEYINSQLNNKINKKTDVDEQTQNQNQTTQTTTGQNTQMNDTESGNNSDSDGTQLVYGDTPNSGRRRRRKIVRVLQSKRKMMQLV